jgi:hypothetical protein
VEIDFPGNLFSSCRVAVGARPGRMDIALAEHFTRILQACHTYIIFTIYNDHRKPNQGVLR